MKAAAAAIIMGHGSCAIGHEARLAVEAWPWRKDFGKDSVCSQA